LRRKYKERRKEKGWKGRRRKRSREGPSNPISRPQRKA
jgi:hypothetical protein